MALPMAGTESKFFTAELEIHHNIQDNTECYINSKVRCPLHACITMSNVRYSNFIFSAESWNSCKTDRL